jgi:peptidoglycan/xylan/chitin deacetylase (PgdA/CDA1 family)
VSNRLRLISLLDRAGVLGLATRAQRVLPLPFLRITGYHRIGDPKIVARDTDEGVVDVTAADFERHVAFLAENFNIIDIATLRRHFLEHTPLPKNPALITFDDGYRECLDVALPVLRRHAATGVFFVSTDHVAQRKAFWWDRIAYLFKRSKRTTVAIEYPNAITVDLEHALTIVKRTYALDLERYLDGLARALDVPWTDAVEKRIAEETLMSWADLRALRDAGMDVQSHTATHRILQTLSDEELERELVSSKRTLEAELDEEICAIAYPSGRPVSQHTKIGRAVRRAGYDLGFSGSGVCLLGKRTDPLDLRRISVDIHAPDAFYRACVVLPIAGL